MMEEYRLQQCDADIDDPTEDDWQWVMQDDRPFACLSIGAALAEKGARQFYVPGEFYYRIVTRTVSAWKEH